MSHQTRRVATALLAGALASAAALTGASGAQATGVPAAPGAARTPSPDVAVKLATLTGKHPGLQGTRASTAPRERRLTSTRSRVATSGQRAASARTATPARTGPVAAPTVIAPLPSPGAWDARCGDNPWTDPIEGDGELGLVLTTTNNRQHLSWKASPSTTLTIKRTRLGGTESTLATARTTSPFTDSSANPLGGKTYRVYATTSSGSYLCSFTGSGNGSFAMSTVEGWTTPDAVISTNKGYAEQSAYDVAVPLTSAPEVTSQMDYSPDGQSFVATEGGASGTSLVVRNARTGEARWSVSGGAGRVLSDPTWSPDGRTIVVSSIAWDGSTASDPILQTVPAMGGALSTLPGSAGLLEPDWVVRPGASTSTEVVAADFSGGPLAFLTLGSSTVRRLAGSDGSRQPTYSPSSVLYLVHGTGGRVARWSSAGPVAIRAASNGETFDNLQVSPDGLSVFYSESWSDAGSSSWCINEQPLDGTVRNTRCSFGTWLGWTRDDASVFGFAVRQPVGKGTSNFSGDANNDILARDGDGSLWVYRTDPTTFNRGGRVRIGTGWNIYRQFVAGGDLDGDARADILAIDTSGALWSYRGLGNATVTPRVQLGTGWSSYHLVATGDLNLDGFADVVARDGGGTLWFYPGRQDGRLTTRSKIGTGWSGMSAILGVGDWNWDSKPDLMARDRASGVMYLYPGNGAGGVSTRSTAGTGWNIMRTFSTLEVVIAEEGPSNVLTAVDQGGVNVWYEGTGDGRFDGGYIFGSGWGSFVTS